MVSSVVRPRSHSTCGPTKHRSWFTHRRPPWCRRPARVPALPRGNQRSRCTSPAREFRKRQASGLRPLRSRVWAVNKNERVLRSWLVAGSKYNNELPGTHKVFSRSEVSTAWNGKAFLPRMIRWLKTDIGNIGFHGIPRHVSDGSRYMKDSELGQRLSGGCQRQADADAAFMWDFAQVGTTVVVI